MINITRLKFIAALALIVALGIFAGFRFGKAYQSEQPAKVVAESGSVVNFNEAPTASDSQGLPNLGALVDPSYLPSRLCQNDNCTDVENQTFIDASTTILSIHSPFLRVTSSVNDVVIYTDGAGQGWTSATATVDLTRLQITGAATTSYFIYCGPSATAGGVLANMNTYNLVSSTAGVRVSTSSIGLIENNNAFGIVSGGTVAKTIVDAARPYFVCMVDPSVAAGFTNALNTFDGKGTVRVNKTR